MWSRSSQASAFIGNLDSLTSRAKTYLDERAYVAQLTNPYPTLLDRDVVAGWSSGQVQLALYQIDGYHGLLKTAPTWVKVCLTSPDIFGDLANHQFNERTALPEGYVDEQNRQILQQRLDQIDNDQIEDAATLRINDPFSKLLTRSRYQLLAKYKDSELPQLDKAELYLLRNAIYARHGYPFNTAKLSKYANRMGWSRPTRKPVSPVESCNAFFLQELHPAQELGSLGRGVLIRDAALTGPANYVRPAICACLGQPSRHVDCQQHAGSSDKADFHSFVDLIIDLETGPVNQVEWTFLNDNDIVGADLDTFKANEERFYASALDFNVAIQNVLKTAGQDLSTAEDKRGPYWKLRLMLSPQTLAALAQRPGLSSSLAQNVCDSVHRGFEAAGPFIPRTDAPPSMPDPDNPVLEINDKPIEFEALRIKLTQEYIKKHYGIALKSIELAPDSIKMLVVHRSDTSSVASFIESVRKSILPGTQEFEDDETADVNMSTHYVIGPKGNIYSLMKDFQIARHSIGLDRSSIGITVVGTSADALSDKQAIATAMLIRYLKRKYGEVTWLVSDKEIGGFQNSPLWEERLPFTIDPRRDPGATFMAQLRSYVADLKFESAPNPPPLASASADAADGNPENPARPPQLK
ncbi:YARHG domain-containing protein [Bradyrhizobium jicamae]|uniref:YARHG domain-containing protein n=1 Tax=Bradyrhizobium jicamae TaxID=280332 RepID=UPI001BAA7E4C|nr:YARHG domain-containing protein [Bradyrhizobium jicamae]MBR0936887.1 YARHG domain-containing protein [Bradyrhizobium jicamae]